MKLLKIIICLFAGMIYTLRYGIGSERYGFNLLDNENEGTKIQAIEKFLGRVFFAIGTIAYQLIFLILSLAFQLKQDMILIIFVLIWSAIINIIYLLYFTFYPVQKQVLTSIGQSIITNFFAPLILKKFKGFTVHQSNLFDIIFWTFIAILLVLNSMMVSAFMIITSLICFGIIALNHFLVDTENMRNQLVGKFRDKKLNELDAIDAPANIKEIKKPQIIISKPL